MEQRPQAYTYPPVGTPDILGDLNRYVLPDASRDDLERAWSAISAHTRHQFTVLAERLEFVAKLEIVRNAIQAAHQPSPRTYAPTQHGIHVTDKFVCEFLGEDFAGVHYDIEALEVYLLISCLDRLAGQADYKNPFDWLKACHSDSQAITLQSLDTLKNEYREECGLNRRFIRQFCNDLSPELSRQWTSGFAVVAVQASDGASPGRLHPESWKQWCADDDTQKLNKIASALYQIRSSFTHDALRTFLHTLPVENIPQDRPQHLVRLDKAGSIREMLISTIQCIATKRLLLH